MIGWKGLAVTIAPSLLDATYQQLRACGQRRRECHLFWVASWRDPGRIVRIVHPEHTATSVSVDIDSSWLNTFFLELADRAECIRVQVHSHPGSAFHSGTDDAWPAVRTPGYLSLVIPGFAAGQADLQDAYLAEQDEAGGWTTAELEKTIRIQDSPSSRSA